MKCKIYILAFFLLLNIAIAAPDLITSDSRPRIDATFNETVNLTAYSLKSLKDNSFIPLNIISSTNMRFTFQPSVSLYNGYYDFLVQAEDLIKNTKTYNQLVIVNSTETQIFLEKPRTGYSTVETFDLIVGTTKPSECRYSFIPTSITSEFDKIDSTKTRHTIEGFHLADKTYRSLFVNCTDNESLSYVKRFEIGVLKEAPKIISAKAIPDVVSVRPPYTTLEVITSQETVCTADGDYFDDNVWNKRETYNVKNTKLFSLPEKQKYTQTISIRCENLAETAVTTTITVSVDLAAPLKITVNSPSKAVWYQDFLNLSLSTNKRALCTYKFLAGQERQLNTTDGLTHTYPLGVISEAKTHNIAISCTSEREKEELIYSFIVDNTLPTAPTIEGWACKASEMEARFSAADNESGIEGFNYTLSSGATTAQLLASGYVAGNNVTIRGLNLSQNITYTLSAIAKNNAGKFGSQTTKAVFFNPNATQCLEKNPPITKLNKTLTGNGVLVTILCYDESGCNVDKFRYAAVGEKQNCTPVTPSPSESKNSTIIGSTSLFCWYVEDNVGNNASKQELIQVGSFVSNCYNLLKDGDETDIDCGGSCAPCPDKSKCIADKDCKSKYCKSGICEEAFCNDSIKNGLETDIDCGGKCDGCEIGSSCLVNSDCKSNYCSDSVCKEAFCNDSIKNGLETDIDCGGNCQKCPAGSGCKEDSDCLSGSCEFFTCKETKFVTPTVEVKEIPIFRYLLLALGILILGIGLAMFYYFKSDKQTSIYVMILGGAALLFALLDFYLNTPAVVPALLSLALVGGASYFIYTQWETIMKQFKPAPKAAPPTTAPQAPAATAKAPEARKPIVTPEQMLATRQMIEMIKKQKQERAEKRKKLFEEFKIGKAGVEKKEIEKELIPIKPVEKIVEKIKEAKKPEDVFERLGKLTKSNDFDKLSKLLEKKPDQAFDKLSDILKKKDVFEKLPQTDKEIDSLIHGKPIEKLRKEVRKTKK